MLVEFSRDLKSIETVIDTNPDRAAAGLALARKVGLAPVVEAIGRLLRADRAVRIGGGQGLSDHPFSAFWKLYDFSDCVAVSLTLGDRRESEIVGLVAFSGKPDLGPAQMAALQTLAYSLGAQVWKLTGAAPAEPVSPVIALTPREKQVMRLSAVGRTSSQIAAELGMSARTVNKHFENVAGKLGTRSRPHTIAELLRRQILTDHKTVIGGYGGVVIGQSGK